MNRRILITAIGISGITIISGCTNNQNTTNQTPSDRSEESNPNNSSTTDDNISSNRSEGSNSDTETGANRSEGSNSGSDDISVRSGETYYYEGDVLRGPYKSDFDWSEEDAMIIDNINKAHENLIDNRNVEDFIQNVDFSRRYILVVRNGMQSTPKLALESLNRQRETLHVDVSVISEGGGVDDLITNSLLVNVIDASGTVPGTVEVKIEGYV